MANENKDVLRPRKTEAQILAGGIKQKQLGFASDTYKIIHRDTDDTYRKWAPEGTDIIGGNLYTERFVYHVGDTDTYLDFSSDRMQIVCGGQTMVDFFETTQDIVEFNPNSNDIDFIVNTDSFSDALFIQGSTGNVCIGYNSPDGRLHTTVAAGSNNTYIDSYAIGTGRPALFLRKSDSDTLGETLETDDTDVLGVFTIQGVDNTNAFDEGFSIIATQNGAAAGFVPTNVEFATYSSSGKNIDQLKLTSDGNISMSGDLAVTGTISGSGVIDGSGTASTIAKWSDSDTLTDSVITESGTYASVAGVTANAEREVFRVQNTDEPATTETGQAVAITGYMKGTIDNGSSFVDQPAGKITFGKQNDYFHTSDARDADGFIKFSPAVFGVIDEDFGLKIAGAIDAASFASEIALGDLNYQSNSKVQIVADTTDVSIGTVSTLATLLVAKGSPDIMLYGSTSGTGSIKFGDVDDVDIGMIDYDHSSDTMGFTAGATEVMTMTSSLVAIDSGVHLGDPSGVNYVDIETDGRMAFIGTNAGIVRGSIYQHDMSTTVTISVAGTHVVAGGFSAGDEDGMTGAATGINVDIAGKYFVTWQCSFTCGTANRNSEGGIGIDGTLQTNTVGQRKIGTGGDVGSMSGSGIVDCALNQDIQLMLSNEDGTENLTIEHAQVTAFMIAGT